MSARRIGFRRALASEPGQQGAPEGYEWAGVRRPQLGKFGTALIGLALILLPSAVAVSHGLDFLGIGLIASGVVCLVCSLPSWGRPVVDADDGSPVLRNPVSHNPMLYQMAAMLVFAAVASWGGATGEAPSWFLYVGGLLFAVTVPSLIVFMTLLGRRTMAFGPETLRIYQGPKSDREFPWDAITDTTVRTIGGSTTQFGLVFSCPRVSVIDHCPPKKFGADDSDDAPRPWVFPLPGWNVEPNALLATLHYFIGNPERRSAVTAEQVAAMLTPPTWTRQWLRRNTTGKVPTQR